MTQLPDIMRPSVLDGVIGNEGIKKVLKGQFDSGNISHTFMLVGQFGSGKTTFAYVIANQLNAQVIEHDAGAKSDIDTIRDLVESAYTTSIFSDRKVYILDEVHKLSKDAQNVLLKVTENPPENVYFILCTSEEAKIIPALASRCVRLEVEPVGLEGIRKAVAEVSKKYKLEVENRQDWFKLVEASDQSLRTAYNHMERLISAGEKKPDGTIYLSSALFSELFSEPPEFDEESGLMKEILSGTITSIIKAIDLEKKNGKKPFETTLGVYRYIRKVAPVKKKGLLTDLAYILSLKEPANSWEGIEWAIFKNL